MTTDQAASAARGLGAGVIPAKAGIQRLSANDAGFPLSRERRRGVIPADAGIQRFSTNDAGFPLSRERRRGVIPADAGIQRFSTNDTGFPLSRERRVASSPRILVTTRGSSVSPRTTLGSRFRGNDGRYLSSLAAHA